MKTRYKVLLAIIAVVGLSVCVKSCIGRKEPDLTLAYVGYDFVNRELFEENKAELEEAVGDVDGNGEAVCEITEISFNENLTSADFSNSQKRMANAVGQGSARVYIMDKTFVEKNKDAEVFADISQMSDKGIKNSAGEVVAVDVSGNEKLARLGIDNGEGMYLSVRKVSEMDYVWNKNTEETDAAAKRAAEYILN